jgi:hypothetical protein
MRRRLRTFAAILGAAALLASLAASPAAAASPWWQVLSGARPTHIAPPSDQTRVQELRTTELPGGTGFAARVEVGGETVGCLGSGFGLGLCPALTGFAAKQTAAGLREMLEGPYGAGVEVSGGPVGGSPFVITTPNELVVPVSATPLPFNAEVPQLGSASVEVLSGGVGLLTIALTNLGNAPVDATAVPVEIADELPDGLAPYGVRGVAGAFRPGLGVGIAGPVECVIESVALLGCSFEGVLAPYEAIELEVLVAVTEWVGAPGLITVKGGDADLVRAEQSVTVSEAPVPFGIEHFEMRAEDEQGKEVTKAGVRPFQLTTTIVANAGRQHGSDREDAEIEQPALPRNLRFTLPAGLVGSATAVPQCELAVFLRPIPDGEGVNGCPDETAIGVSSVSINDDNLRLNRLAVPVFNLPPARGEPARFGLMVAGVASIIDTSVDPADGYRITAEVRNVPQVIQFLAATTTIWGVPGDQSHDASRGWDCAFQYLAHAHPDECVAPATRRGQPFLRMPTQCRDKLTFDAGFEPWNTPPGSVLDTAASESQESLRACNQVPFDPRISASLTSRLAQNPSGLDFELSLPNPWPEDANAAPEAQPNRIEVALPKGVTINPSQAEGLATCPPERYAAERYDSRPGEGCPEASKIGSIEASSPLIEEKLEGSLYVATPYRNPFDSLIAVYVVARSAERGVLVKQPLEVRPDERTGRLVSIAEDAPPLPYDHFRLHFREGARSPLITPPGCGTFHTTARFVPYSAVDLDNPAPDEVVERTAPPFTIDRGVDGGACPQGSAPFHPGFEAGTLNNQAGSYSPFAMRITRRDGEQDLSRFSAVLPPGVLGRIAGVGRCSEAAIARAASRTGQDGGRSEIIDPSCPFSARLGSTLAGAGVGSQLIYVPGSLYLAGPYNGAPLSVVAITPAVAGPFDAGVVVVRVALTLDPVSGKVEVDGSASDPIPHILKGIPLNLRDLRVSVDRPGFTLNATSCAEERTVATLFGAGTVLAPLPDTPVARIARYQAAGCRGLGFKPKLGIKLKGGTRRATFPALRVHYRPRAADANLKRLALAFPSSAFIEQGHFRTICTRVQFAAGAGHGSQCPKGAVYGRARVWTPLLDEPLVGPVYLRSSDNNLPDAVLALRGIVDIEVAARIDSVKGRLRAIVDSAPDAPVSRVIVDMHGGQKGLFVNSRNLCVKPKRNRARVNLRGQNGRRSATRPVVRAERCAKRGRGRSSRAQP